MPPEDGRIAARDGLLAGGGPAATAAVTLARLGVPVELISVVGDDVAGDLIVAGLDRERVGTRFVRRAPGARSALSVGLIRPRPASTRSLVALAPIGATIDIDEDALEACRTASWIHVDHAGWRLVAWLRSQGIETPVAVDGGNPLDPQDPPRRGPVCAGTGRAAALHWQHRHRRRARGRDGRRWAAHHRDPGRRGLDLPWLHRPRRAVGRPSRADSPTSGAGRGPGIPALRTRTCPRPASMSAARWAPATCITGPCWPGCSMVAPSGAPWPMPRPLRRCPAPAWTAAAPSRPTSRWSRR